MNAGGRLVVVSNRLPVTTEIIEGRTQLKHSGGGLVSALTPILNESGGSWIGWPGGDYDARDSETFSDWCSSQNYSLVPVGLSVTDLERFYRGYANEIIWPLFHGLPSLCSFNPSFWEAYCTANAKFADAVKDVAGPGDFIWVHDYHLMMLAHVLRSRGHKECLAYFHHIPFPAPDTFEKLPWRAQVLRGLLQFNVIGFQTPRDRNNFVACLRRCLPNVHVSRTGEKLVVRAGQESTTVGTYPISVDFKEFATAAADDSVADQCEAIRSGLGDTRIVLSVDRLDYTKGIPERFAAFDELLQRNPHLLGRISLVQIAVPSREEIPEYAQLKLRVERMVSRINEEHRIGDWIPVRYAYRSICRSELVALYLAADVALVTPLKDGMNLVAKEFCASRIDNQGVLILSEFAGAAEELRRGAILVNPYDSEDVSSAIVQALNLDRLEQRSRMRVMREYIRANDVFQWSRSFTAEAVPFYGAASLCAS